MKMGEGLSAQYLGQKIPIYWITLDTSRHVRLVFHSVARSIQLSFIKSAADYSGAPQDGIPEVGIVGRSNAGKSSFLNSLSPQKVAKVSGTPGKTRTLNFFEQKTGYRWVDMPGYGFAARSKKEVKSWQGMIEDFIANRGNLVGLILIMDIRRSWSADESLIFDFCNEVGVPIVLALNKADKISRSRALQAKKKILEESGLEKAFIMTCLKKTGARELEDFVFRNWVLEPEADQEQIQELEQEVESVQIEEQRVES